MKLSKEFFAELIGVVFGWVAFGVGLVLMVIGAVGGGTVFYVLGIALMALGGYLAASAE